MSKKPVIFSGIQPTGNLHIGNYLGAVKNIVDLQNSNKYEVYYFIADYHALTGMKSAEELKNGTLTVAAELIAAGIDPAKTTLFVQSHVAEHTELAWIFNCVTPVAELNRMTQFKDKSAHQEKNINAGLLTYPILQAADILIYHGSVVPVGKDQEQHVELTRNIATWFNKKYGNYFPITKSLFTPIPKVMSLLEPTKKMSKSLGEGHVIELREEPKQIEAKLKKAVTASVGGATSPGVANLLSLLKHFDNQDVYTKFTQAEKDGSIRYGELKQVLAQSIANHFTNFRAKRAELLANPKELHTLLQDGATRARAVAQKTMTEVRELIGVR